MGGARVVVIATVPTTIRSAGISTYLVAMALKKCVIITDGPATRVEVLVVAAPAATRVVVVETLPAGVPALAAGWAPRLRMLAGNLSLVAA